MSSLSPFPPLPPPHLPTSPLPHSPLPPTPRVSLEARIGKNLAGWVGAIVLVLGVGFFLKYAWQHEWIHPSPLGRVTFAALAGVGLGAIGEWLYRKPMRGLAAPSAPSETVRAPHETLPERTSRGLFDGALSLPRPAPSGCGRGCCAVHSGSVRAVVRLLRPGPCRDLARRHRPHPRAHQPG